MGVIINPATLQKMGFTLRSVYGGSGKTLTLNIYDMKTPKKTINSKLTEAKITAIRDIKKSMRGTGKKIIFATVETFAIY